MPGARRRGRSPLRSSGRALAALVLSSEEEEEPEPADEEVMEVPGGGQELEAEAAAGDKLDPQLVTLRFVGGQTDAGERQHPGGENKGPSGVGWDGRTRRGGGRGGVGDAFGDARGLTG